MPKFELIGTRGSGPAEMHIYRDETGRTMEIPAAVSRARPTGYSQDNAANVSKNVVRADERERARLQSNGFPGGPGSGEQVHNPEYPSYPDMLNASPHDVRRVKLVQDREQVELNRRNIADLEAYKHQVLAANPSAGGGPTVPGGITASAPPTQQLTPQPAINPGWPMSPGPLGIPTRADRELLSKLSRKKK